VKVNIKDAQMINKAELERLKNTKIYSRKTINKILRTSFFTKNVNDTQQYTFQQLVDCFWGICREHKTLVFEEQVEKERHEVYAIYPLKEHIVWCSILHNFGNLCFAHTNLSVDVVLEALRFESVETVCAEYNLHDYVVRKVLMIYGEKQVVKKECAFKDLLGTMSDNKLAQKVGCSRENIRLLRKKYNIPVYKKPDTWSNEHIELLGKLPDKQVSEITGHKVYKVFEKKKELNIAGYTTERKWSEEELALLGTMSDYQLSQKLDITQSLIQRKRKSLNIPTHRKHSRWNPVVQWTPELDALFQTMRVAEIARKLNVHYQVVYMRKQKLAQK
jgi:uncharacterized protein (DUF433 family)